MMRKTGLAALTVLGALLLPGAARAASCSELEARLDAIERADRTEWESGAPSGDPYVLERERLGVLKALAVNRCPSAQVRPKGRVGRILSDLFGRSPPRADRWRDGRGAGSFSGGIPAAGSYRTLCVRSCDGYYFPISFATPPRDLKRDAAACQALCPGQEVALYVRPGGDGEGSPQVSLSGVPYSALPTAFRYRSEYDRSCTCGAIDATLAAAFQAFSVPPPQLDGTVVGAIAAPGVPMPRLRPGNDGAEAPIAPLQDEIGVTAVTAGVGNAVAYVRGPDGGKVRLVGPADGYILE